MFSRWCRYSSSRQEREDQPQMQAHPTLLGVCVSVSVRAATNLGFSLHRKRGQQYAFPRMVHFCGAQSRNHTYFIRRSSLQDCSLRRKFLSRFNDNIQSIVISLTTQVAITMGSRSLQATRHHLFDRPETTDLTATRNQWEGFQRDHHEIPTRPPKTASRSRSGWARRPPIDI
jgi:hypothetical protein